MLPCKTLKSNLCECDAINVAVWRRKCDWESTLNWRKWRYESVYGQ